MTYKQLGEALLKRYHISSQDRWCGNDRKGPSDVNENIGDDTQTIAFMVNPEYRCIHVNCFENSQSGWKWLYGLSSGITEIIIKNRCECGEWHTTSQLMFLDKNVCNYIWTLRKIERNLVNHKDREEFLTILNRLGSIFESEIKDALARGETE